MSYELRKIGEIKYEEINLYKSRLYKLETGETIECTANMIAWRPFVWGCNGWEICSTIRLLNPSIAELLPVKKWWQVWR